MKPNVQDWEPTPTEIAIEKLREAIKDVKDDYVDIDDDFSLIRWLRATNMDVNKAEKMLRRTIIWRKEHDLERLVYEDIPLELADILPIYTDGFAKDGTPVASTEAGKADLVGILKERGREEAIHYCRQVFAQAEVFIMDANRKKFMGQPLNENSFKGAIAIVDFNKFSYRQLQSITAVQTAIEICTMLVNHFPDLGGEMYCINCNVFSSIVLKTLRPIVESQHLKVHVFGTNKKEWQNALLEKIPATQIRAPFGGTRTGPMLFVRPPCLEKGYLKSLVKSS